MCIDTYVHTCTHACRQAVPLATNSQDAHMHKNRPARALSFSLALSLSRDALSRHTFRSTYTHARTRLHTHTHTHTHNHTHTHAHTPTSDAHSRCTLTRAHRGYSHDRCFFTVLSLVLLWYVVRNTFPVMILRDSLNKQKRQLVSLPLFLVFVLGLKMKALRA